MIEGEIPGYTYGTSEVAKSPLSDEAFEKLKSSVGFTDEDVQYLKLAGEILTGEPMESFTNAHLERGKVMEPEARELYGFVHDC